MAVLTENGTGLIMASHLKKILSKHDIQPLDVYTKHRDTERLKIVALKKQRRLSIGPDAVFHFENSETIRFQIQEMLYIEKGGESQIQDELTAYSSLLPQGSNLTATVMFEIADPNVRKQRLLELGHVEDTIVLKINTDAIKAVSVDTAERTTKAGKTSAVHFLSFPLNSAQKSLFKNSNTSVVLEISHPAYPYSADILPQLREILANDLE